MATQPQYAATPAIGMAQVSVANTNRDGTGTLATVLTAGASGSRIDAIGIKAVGTTTNGMVRLFIHDGTNARLWLEIPVLAITPSGTVGAFEAAVNNATTTQMPLVLPTGYSLRASTHNAETFNVIVTNGGNF